MSPSPILLVTPTVYLRMDGFIGNHHHHLPTSLSSHSSSIRRKRRKEVAVFIKVLLDYLERSDPDLMRKAKEVIADCIQKNRSGHGGDYDNLAFVIQQQARAIVGEWHWTRVKLIILYARQASRKRNRTRVTSSTGISISNSAASAAAPSELERGPDFQGSSGDDATPMQVISRTA